MLLNKQRITLAIKHVNFDYKDPAWTYKLKCTDFITKKYNVLYTVYVKTSFNVIRYVFKIHRQYMSLGNVSNKYPAIPINLNKSLK